MSKPTQMQRAAGVLLPVSSLPSPYGVGTFGESARRWVDFLAGAGQRYWQVLPLGPTGYGDSPYQSFSAYAGNPYFVDPGLLCAQGLLRAEECSAPDWGDDARYVDYMALFQHREALLRLAFTRFTDFSALEAFRVKHAEWVEDYALFMALKGKMGMRPWYEWGQDIRLRKPQALERVRESLQADIRYHIFVQYLFFSQWAELKAYANAQGVGMIGDIPIYVAMDSADTWANSELFLLDEENKPIEVAGVPPDGFSATGQLWGNPLYRWDHMRRDGYRWWMKRLKACFTLYDVLRIDHFRGLESYYAIPYGECTAQNGVWRKGPGMDFIEAVNREFAGQARVIAEDLGYLTDEVRELLRGSGYPGMKVLQFAFDSREQSDYMPHNYTSHSVVYTGTHDNDTVKGWFATAPAADVALAREYWNLPSGAEGGQAFIRAALGSVAELAIIPIQDYLECGNEARINIPATVGGQNWRWRLLPDEIGPELAVHMKHLARLYGRCS